MKIISGKYKGKILKGFNINGTRPTMDRIKESVFAMIQDYVKDSIVLDLYSGSGNLAIEALSNGAKKAYLVDKNKDAINIIKNNIKELNINAAIIMQGDSIYALDNYINDNITFNIIFLDPPYDTNLLDKSLCKINDNINLLSNNGLIICETTMDINYLKYNNLIIYKTRKYGEKIVTILKRK